MLQANKANLVTGFHLKTLDIRNYELDYFLMVFDKMSAIASLMGGFASSAMMYEFPAEDSYFAICIFLISTSCAFGSHLLVVMLAAMCTIWGPGKALRGHDATSMDTAIRVLEEVQESALRWFVFGMVCYFFSSILVVWLLFKTQGAIVITSLLGTILLWLIFRACHIWRMFKSTAPSTGHLRGHSVVNVGELMGDERLTAAQGVTAHFATSI